MKALVTGASGFVGRVLIEKLRARGDHVRGFVRGTSRVEPLKRLGVELFHGDLSDHASLKHSAAGMDVIFHTAARVDPWGTRSQFYEANVLGTRHVIEALRAARVPRLIYFSSVAVYGDQTGVISETTPRLRIGDFYTDTKIEAEELTLDYAFRHGLAVVVLRPALIYGAHDSKYIPRLVENILKGRMRIVGSGDNIVPLVYGDDVADLALRAAQSEAAIGEIFNVASGELVTWKTFLNTLAQTLGTRLPRAHIPVPVLYSAATIMEVLWKMTGAKAPPPATRFGVRILAADGRYDITKAERILGYLPKVFYEEGIKRTLAWMRESNLPGGR